jgi:hypothetical protein
MRHIIAVAFSPHSAATKGAMLRPAPCSAFSAPSCFRTTSWTSSVMNAEYRARSPALPKSATSVKCILPCAACPATPGRNPCLVSNSWTSCAPSARRAGGKQASSVFSIDPSGRFLPIRSSKPSRTCQASSIASSTLVNSTGRRRLLLLTRSRTCRCVASSDAASVAPNSTRSAAALGSGVFQYDGVSAKACPAAFSAGAIINPTAEAPSATRPGTREMASSMVGNGIQATLVTLDAGTVSVVASTTKASAPSDPTSRRRKISSGLSPSSSAQSR